VRKGKGGSECRKTRREGGQRLHKKVRPTAADPRCSSATLQLRPALAAPRCRCAPQLRRCVRHCHRRPFDIRVSRGGGGNLKHPFIIGAERHRWERKAPWGSGRPLCCLGPVVLLAVPQGGLDSGRCRTPRPVHAAIRATVAGSTCLGGSPRIHVGCSQSQSPRGNPCGCPPWWLRRKMRAGAACKLQFNRPVYSEAARE
jgi:hypothetical protein